MALQLLVDESQRWFVIPDDFIHTCINESNDLKVKNQGKATKREIKMPQKVDRLG